MIAAIKAALPDLVTLEEVWSAASQRAFIDAFGSALPFARTDGIDTPLRMGSGLVMLSRHELRTDPDPARAPLPAFTPFAAATGFDRAADKGYLTVQVRPSGAAPFSVIHTHTQSGAQAADIAVRAEQFAQIGRTLDRIHRHFGEPAIVLGDLNVIGEAGLVPTREWTSVAALLGAHRLVDGYRACHPDIRACPGLTYDGAKNALIRTFAPSDSMAAGRLDYVWSPRGPSWPYRSIARSTTWTPRLAGPCPSPTILHSRSRLISARLQIH